MVRSIGWFAGGLLLAIVLAATINIASHYALSRDRHLALTKTALATRIFQDRPGVTEEMFSECVLLMMQWLREDDLGHDVVESLWVRPGPENLHPCRMMSILLGMESNNITFAQPTIYHNYPFGPRYVLALAEAAIGSIQGVRLFYEIVSYAAVLSMLVAAIAASEMVWPMVPIVAVLSFGFAQHGYAHNLAAAPIFATIFLTLALMIGGKRWFEPLHRRIGLMALLGVMVHYLDLVFSIPFAMSLALVVNHLFFVRARNGTARDAVVQGLVVSTSLAGGYLVSFVLHVYLMSTMYGFGLLNFTLSILSRMESSVNGVPISHLDLILQLYAFLPQLTGGISTAIALGLFSVAAWIAAAICVRKWSEPIFVDFTVLVVASSAIFIWYANFVNHTYGHAFFTVRLLALPIAYGFVALILATRIDLAQTSNTV